MLLDDFIIRVYCLIDDLLEEITKGKRIRERGPLPHLFDSEVITMEIVGEFLGMDEDKKIHFYFKTHWLSFFPKIGDRTAFVRQATNLWAYKQEIQRRLCSLLRVEFARVQIVDGFPMPLCNFRRAHFSKLFKGEAAYGYCASKNQNYYGFKGHLLMDSEGTIFDCVAASANLDEREALFDMSSQISDLVLGDKGYICKEARKEELRQEGIRLETPLKDNMKEARSFKEVNLLKRIRRRIETVIGQLTERFHIEKIRARDVWHLTHRTIRKILAHTVCIFINRENGNFNLQFDRLVKV